MSYAMTIVAACVMTLSCASCARSFLAAVKAGDHARAFWFKGTAALSFLALGLLGAVDCSRPAIAWRVAAGLLMGLVGDQLLALRFLRPERHDVLFVAGAVSFAIGHGLYIWALLSLAPGSLPLALLLTALLVAASLLYLRKKRFDAGPLQVCAYVYIAVVALMGSTAAAVAIRSMSPGAALFALGGLSFIVSDNVLCVFSFGADRRFRLNVIVHITYYAAQVLIGWSLFLI